MAGQLQEPEAGKIISIPATEHGAIQAAFAKKPRLIPKNLEILEVGSQGGQGAGDRGDETADYIDFL